jgi:hypothetical protein
VEDVEHFVAHFPKMLLNDSSLDTADACILQQYIALIYSLIKNGILVFQNCAKH